MTDEQIKEVARELFVYLSQAIKSNDSYSFEVGGHGKDYTITKKLVSKRKA